MVVTITDGLLRGFHSIHFHAALRGAQRSARVPYVILWLSSRREGPRIFTVCIQHFNGLQLDALSDHLYHRYGSELNSDFYAFAQSRILICCSDAGSLLSLLSPFLCCLQRHDYMQTIRECAKSSTRKMRVASHAAGNAKWTKNEIRCIETLEGIIEVNAMAPDGIRRLTTTKEI